MSSVLGAIGLGAGLAANAAGAIGSAVSNRRRGRFLDDKERENERMYNRDYYQNLNQRGDIMRIMRTYRDKLDEAVSGQNQRNAVMGSSSSLESAQRQANAGSMANAVSSIAAQGSRLKDIAKERYVSQKNNILLQRQNLAAMQAQQWANLAKNGTNAVVGALSMYGNRGSDSGGYDFSGMKIGEEDSAMGVDTSTENMA